MEKCLFLHWGPGGNLEIERQSFKTHFGENTLLWDQPGIKTLGSNPFLGLLAASEKVLLEEYNKTKIKLSIYGHSFGAQIALHLAQSHPGSVSKLILAACTPNVGAGFVQLGLKLSKIYSDDKIRQASLLFERTHYGFPEFQGLVGAITAHPDFLLHYWGHQSFKIRDQYLALSQTYPILDFEGFMGIIQSFLSHSHPKPMIPCSIPVRILLGKDDPFMDLPKNKHDWLELIPHATVEEFPVGHFIHLEAPQSFRAKNTIDGVQN